jgi:hypothetical protein
MANIATSATSLFALPEAGAFLKALQRKKLIIQQDIERDTFYQEATFNDEKKTVSSEQARRLGQTLFGFIDRASAALSVDDNAVWQALPMVPRDDFTTGEKELKSPIYRARRRSELNAMIEQHTQTQTS